MAQPCGLAKQRGVEPADLSLRSGAWVGHDRKSFIIGPNLRHYRRFTLESI